jgi:hypothetical protein
MITGSSTVDTSSGYGVSFDYFIVLPLFSDACGLASDLFEAANKAVQYA